MEVFGDLLIDLSTKMVVLLGKPANFSLTQLSTRTACCNSSGFNRPAFKIICKLLIPISCFAKC